MALRVGRHLPERVALHDFRELRARAYDDRDVQAELVHDQPLALPRHLVRGARGREDDVAALHVRLHVAEPGAREHVAQLRHRHAVARADVDAPQENDVLRHPAQITATGMLIGWTGSWPSASVVS